jgi:(1->4)-alpha-D-glucan 1-alpha-D-glucosylmutase
MMSQTLDPTTFSQPPLHLLARLANIETHYEDGLGNANQVSDKTLQALLGVLGFRLESPSDTRDALRCLLGVSWQQWLAPVQVLKQTHQPLLTVSLQLPANLLTERFYWRIRLEGGRELSGDVFDAATLPTEPLSPLEEAVETVSMSSLGGERKRLTLALSCPLPLGYHELIVGCASREELPETVQSLIVVPGQCYLPHDLHQPETRLWGLDLQLYTVRSARNWGIGDFSDLVSLVDWVASHQGSFIRLNPLHALYPLNVFTASPYSPSSREFLNILYLDVEAIPEFYESEEARRVVLAPEFQSRLAALREQPHVDYESVAQLKLSVLESLYQTFIELHLRHDSPRAQAFLQFLHEGGEALYGFALFEALNEHFQKENPAWHGWDQWPDAYRSPDSHAVKAFEIANPERIRFYQYLQWNAAEQLHRVSWRALERRLPIGLILTLGAGADAHGAEVWQAQGLYSLKARLGAPPDAYNHHGQNWGFPVVRPDLLKRTGYAAFIRLLRHAMREAGALQINQLSGLFRQFWCPAAEDASDGACGSKGSFVHLPTEDLLGIIALESHRNQCVVLAEGTASTLPDWYRERLESSHILSHRILYFEKDADGLFQSPEAHESLSLISLSSHDLPPLCGFWEGQDLSLRAELGLYPSDTHRTRHIQERVMERVALLAVLEKESLLPEGVTSDPASAPTMTAPLNEAVHAYLSRSSARLLAIRLEDVLEQAQPLNLPGTSLEYANWRQRLPVALETLDQDVRVQSVLAVLDREGKRFSSSVLTTLESNPSAAVATLPRATYRLQFNHRFTFQDATALVPYLAALGVSHCYASPLLEANPGSLHGYDISSHNRLNPEIGSWEDFLAFSSALKAHDIKLIVDIVPNHMGIGQSNTWWLDVLENGPASAYARYFDIDWQAAKPELNGKVNLPMLGQPYGKILANDELSLRFHPTEGRLTLHYYEHTLPINPRSYPMVLAHRLDVLSARLGVTDPDFWEFESVVRSFESLPQHMDSNAGHLAVRIREKTIAMRRLADLCRHRPEVSQFIEENLQDFATQDGDPVKRQRFHRLLEAQAYRLAYWRVAADEINYRRFFDINELAALRMEDGRVFADTHAFLLDLIRQGHVHGLRIDHPDGLFDPAGYFAQLQEEAAHALGIDDWQPDGQRLLNAPDLPLYLIVEKILAPYEYLPENWPVHGTTGYEFANAVTGVLINRAAEEAFTQLYESFVRRSVDFEEMVHHCKTLISKTLLASELNVLANLLDRISEKNLNTRDFTLNNLRNALAEVVACFPVYRSYVTPEGPGRKDRDFIEWAIQKAKRRNIALDPSIFDFIRSVLLLEVDPDSSTDDYREAITLFTMKFQQYTGPVMAKGLEDTTFYRFNRLVALNEVGGEPSRFGLSVAAFHQINLMRARRTPHGLLASSTHDTKRSEDVRSRLCVLSEVPAAWQAAIRHWSELNRDRKRRVDELVMPTPNDEYLFYQSLLGVWPFHPPTATDLAALTVRLQEYMIKAVREAKAMSSWINPHVDYEEAVCEFIRLTLTPGPQNSFLQSFQEFTPLTNHFGVVNSLSQTLLKLTVPGVPDVYQGSELWDFSLVDPDNRRPVDYGLRQQLLAQLSASPSEDRLTLARQSLEQVETGLLKMLITRSTLQLRQELAPLFQDGQTYQPLQAVGPLADHLIAFGRINAREALITLVPRLPAQLCNLLPGRWPLGEEIWHDTRLLTPADWVHHTWENVLTGERYCPMSQDNTLRVGALLKHFPVGLWRASRNR